MSGLRRHVWLMLAALAVAFALVGLGRGEFAAVRTQANVLCTACIGLTGGH